MKLTKLHQPPLCFSNSFPGNLRALEYSRYIYMKCCICQFSNDEGYSKNASYALNLISTVLLKRKRKLNYFQFHKTRTYHFTSNRYVNLLNARLLHRYSSLSSDLFRSHFSCGARPEIVGQYFLYCTKYVILGNIGGQFY